MISMPFQPTLGAWTQIKSYPTMGTCAQCINWLKLLLNWSLHKGHGQACSTFVVINKQMQLKWYMPGDAIQMIKDI